MPKILDVKVDNLNFAEVWTKIRQFLSRQKLHQIVTVNPEFIVAAQKDKEFRQILNGADLCVPDGAGLRLAAWLTGQKIGERITGMDLTWELAKLAAENGYSIYFLGAKPGVAALAAKRIKLIYPNLKIAGSYCGSPHEEGIVGKINDANPDILLVAFGAPKQEKFIFAYKNELKVKVAVGVGGTFDYISGNVKRAPRWMRSLGLEWLYRLFRQPSRLGRIFRAVVVFPMLVLLHRQK